LILQVAETGILKSSPKELRNIQVNSPTLQVFSVEVVALDLENAEKIGPLTL